MTSLLERALAENAGKRRFRVPNHEEIELAIAFMRGRVNSMQVAVATGRDKQNIPAWAAGVIRRAAMGGVIEVRLRAGGASVSRPSARR